MTEETKLGNALAPALAVVGAKLGRGAASKPESDSPFAVAVTDVYEGPLDLLLDLIRKQDIDIYDIPIARITEQYLAYVEKLPKLPLGETAQFILVASTLLLIKSRTLLPTLDLSQDERESVEELERRLARAACSARAFVRQRNPRA